MWGYDPEYDCYYIREEHPEFERLRKAIPNLRYLAEYDYHYLSSTQYEKLDDDLKRG